MDDVSHKGRSHLTTKKTASYLDDEEKDNHKRDGRTVSFDEMNKKLKFYTEKILSDPSNKSMTKRFLTMDLADQEVNVRTADDVGLGQCVYVNFNNPHSLLPYAASADCYCVFCDFFGPLIEELHGQPQDEACLEPIYGDIEKYEFTDLNFNDRSRVIYSEVTLRRNFEAYPFTPMMGDTDRKKNIKHLESIFRKIFKEEEEVAEIPPEWEQKFDKIKNELDDLGAMKHYPSDRLHLMFQTVSDIMLGVVVNFDDHMQIITSSFDGRVGKLYQKMHEIYTDESLDQFDYVAHPFLGYLTLSPAHIGTGLTIRLIAKFPFLSRMSNLEMSVLRNHDVIVELENPDCLSSGLLVITNKKTLNKTEEDIFNDVVNAFNVLYELEQEMEATTPMAVQNDTTPVESLMRLIDMISKSDSRSYTKKYLSPSIAIQYENMKTRFGSTLGHCIRANAIYPESLYPRAVDSDCYSTFRFFFTPILYEVNKISSTAHAPSPSYGSASDNSQYMLTHRDILSYRVRFTRNFEKYAFPNTMSLLDREDVERIIVSTFEEFPVELEGTYIPLRKIKSSLYYEDFLAFRLLPELTDVEKSLGFSRDWPFNRGIFFANKDLKYPELVTVIFINITDHMKVVCLDPTGKSLHACYDRAVKFMQFLDLRFEKIYARKPGYGYLTTFPQSVGCGLRVSAKVFLKNLGDNREVLERKCQLYHMVYRGSNGSGTPAINNVFDLSLKFNMNVTEKWILLTFCQRLKEIILAEREYDCRIPKPSNDIFIEEEFSKDGSSFFTQRSPDGLSDYDTNQEYNDDINGNFTKLREQEIQPEIVKDEVT